MSTPSGAPFFDVAVVGSGAAGLSAALGAADAGLSVALVCKSSRQSGSTRWAQGGIAAAIGDGDSPAEHARDTMTAAAGLADEEAVRQLTEAAPALVARLQELGAQFDLADGKPSLGREGGHSRNRILHAGGDATGREVSRALLAVLSSETRVTLLEDTVALDLQLDLEGRACGLWIAKVDRGGSLDEPLLLRAGAVVLASGGLGQLFETTTNPPESTGDGLAMASRAGAFIEDLEFVQFHPTALAAGRSDQLPLLTEALRGEGALLVDDKGTRFMVGVHPYAELAPRDVVAAEMARIMGEGGDRRLFLDMRPVGAALLRSRFPTVVEICARAGIDPSLEPVPVAPAAHYSCGGVAADLDGRTSVSGLFAVGEVAATGVHGANRLASNSLLEALLSGTRAARGAVSESAEEPGTYIPRRPQQHVPGVYRQSLVSAASKGAGLLRCASGLTGLLAELANVPLLPGAAPDLQSAEATSLHEVATLLATAALTRTESRGCHRRTDEPFERPEWVSSVCLRGPASSVEVEVRPRSSTLALSEVCK